MFIFAKNTHAFYKLMAGRRRMGGGDDGNGDKELRMDRNRLK